MSASVRSGLQLLADYRGLNLVLDENIRGSLSMRMKDVSWDEAIEYVTSLKGLLYTVEDNFYVSVLILVQVIHIQQMLMHLVKIRKYTPARLLPSIPLIFRSSRYITFWLRMQ